MAISYVAKGTVQTKAVASSLSILDVAFAGGSTILVGICSLDTQGDPTSVAWGDREFEKLVGLGNTTGNIRTSVWLLQYVRRPETFDIVATWAGTLAAKAMVVTQLEEVTVLDVQGSATQNASTAPNTGTAVTTTEADTIQLAFFGSDTAASTAAGTVGEGHTSGQRAGNMGTNSVTVHETYEVLAATGNARGSKTGAGSANWASAVVALKKRQIYTVIGAYENRWITDTDADDVIVVLESETVGDIFQVRVDPDVFDAFTDQELTDYLRKACTWHADHRLDDTYVAPEIPAARTTRFGTLVDQEIVI